MSAKLVLFVGLGLFTLFYLTVLVRGARAARTQSGDGGTATPGGVATGFVTNFFDTLGIGSFATTTAIFRSRFTPAQRRGLLGAFAAALVVGNALVFVFASRIRAVIPQPMMVAAFVSLAVICLAVGLAWNRPVADERIPGTLNVGHTLPTIAQAYIFTTLVPIDGRTLIGMIAAAILGAWLGAGVVSRWPRRRIQLGMAFALAVLAAIMAWRTAKGDPSGGTLLRLDGSLFVLGLAGNFLLGALMTIGIGLYAPCMILISLLGMNPTAAFPIMMGSCAFLMPVASARFVRERAFDIRASLGLLLGGIPAALIAGLLVKSLPLTAVKWIVVVVVLYTAVTLYLAARRERTASIAVRGEAEAATT